MSICLQKSASIQPRTSLLKICKNLKTKKKRAFLCRSVSCTARRWRRRRRLFRRFSGAYCSTRLATTHHSFLGSFSAGSTATIATKYSFFQVFRDLQNYLAKFSKILQNFAKNQRFSQKSALFLQKSGNFAKILQNFAIFCKILKKILKILFPRFSRFSLLFAQIS